MKSVIIRPIVTEKASQRLTDNQYSFLVENGVNKIEVKSEIESRFGVKVARVNILNRKGKERRRGRTVGRTKDSRIAVVSLQSGQEIEAIKGLF